MPSATPTTTPIPDAILDNLPDFTNAQLRILLYVARRTFGWKKGADVISMDQLTKGNVRKKDGRRFDHGTGLTARAVRRTVNQLTDPHYPGAPGGGPWLEREHTFDAHTHRQGINLYRLVVTDPDAADLGGETDSEVRPEDALPDGLQGPWGTDSTVRPEDVLGTDSTVRPNNKHRSTNKGDNNKAASRLRRSTRSQGPEPLAEGDPGGSRGEGEGPALPAGEGAQALNKLGMPLSVAAQLEAAHGAERCLEVAMAARKSRVDKPGGWCRRALERGWDVSTAAQRAAQQAIADTAEGGTSPQTPARRPEPVPRPYPFCAEEGGR